jgi:hypothetical protein
VDAERHVHVVLGAPHGADGPVVPGEQLVPRIALRDRRVDQIGEPGDVGAKPHAVQQIAIAHAGQEEACRQRLIHDDAVAGRADEIALVVLDVVPGGGGRASPRPPRTRRLSVR